MFRKKRKIVPGEQGPASREESLAFVPVRNREVREEVLEGGLIRLNYLVSLKPWFATVAQRFGKWDGRPMEKKLELDEMGTLAWSRIDGRNTVRDIARVFVETYGLHQREAEMSVTAFLKELGRRGIVGMR